MIDNQRKKKVNEATEAENEATSQELEELLQLLDDWDDMEKPSLAELTLGIEVSLQHLQDKVSENQ